MRQPDLYHPPPDQPQPQPQPQQQASSSTPPPWSASVNYPYGAVVWYAGSFWRCEAGHSSRPEPDGAPTNNLYLWTPIGSSGGYPSVQQFAQQQQQHPQQGYYSQPAPSYYDHQAPGSSQGYYNAPIASSSSQLYAPVPRHPSSLAPSPSHYEGQEKDDTPSSGETVTAPYDLAGKRGLTPSGSTAFFANMANESIRYITLREEAHKAKDKDELKDELKGKRVWRVGGLGVWAYSDDKEQEETKKRLWRDWGEKHGQKDWLEVARERKQFYEKESKGVKPLFQWKLVEKGQRLPDDALPIGNEQDGAALYAARAWWEGGVHLGKAGHHLNNGASISYGGAEIGLDTYEVLCGPLNEPYLVKWMTYRHGEIAKVEGWQPVEGGREKDGTALLLAKGEYENGQHPGKCLINDDHACVGYGGGELWVRPFSILAYADADRR
ncbi:hypothetical protein I317_02528 [Kwoniella heveanensis CBS 569]|nr:hypothetical protein I317_02528 [Kwoniella heveanensis CBS 569]